MKKLVFLSICVVSTFACTKEKFTGTHSFWYNTETADDLLAFGVNELTLYVDETEISTIDAYDHYTADPGCGTGKFVYTDKMFKKENKQNPKELDFFRKYFEPHPNTDSYDQDHDWNGIHQQQEGRSTKSMKKRTP